MEEWEDFTFSFQGLKMASLDIQKPPNIDSDGDIPLLSISYPQPQDYVERNIKDATDILKAHNP